YLAKHALRLRVRVVDIQALPGQRRRPAQLLRPHADLVAGTGRAGQPLVQPGDLDRGGAVDAVGPLVAAQVPHARRIHAQLAGDDQVGPADGGQGLQPSLGPDRGDATRWKPALPAPLLPQPVGLARVRAAAAVVVGGGGAVAAGRAVTPVDHAAPFAR